MKKTVILAVPYMYGFDQYIEKNLKFHGYDVINLCFDDRHSYYPNLGSRIISTYHKLFTKDLNYKKTLKFSRFQEEISQKLATLNGKKADYAICIRANIYPKEIIAAIRQHSEICVNYQWDGIGRFPDILQYMPYFDRCWVFDPNDVERYPQYNLKATTNFFFDLDIEEQVNNNKLYFLGGYAPHREEHTKLFIKEAKKHNLPLDFYIYCKDDRAHQAFGSEGITYLTNNTVLSIEQNMHQIKGCQAVVDFVQFSRYGLSFRIFEALRFDKKLITNNHTILETDFYHPDNIFLWEGDSLDGIEDFLSRPYQPVPAEIKQKYAFKNWIKNLVDVNS